MAHDMFVRIVSMSLGATESVISISEVQIRVITTWCICSSIAFACGVLRVVGLGLMPYSLHSRLKCNLNSLPLSNIIFRQRGYLQNQHLLTKLLTMSEDLSMYASLAFLFFSVVGTMSSTGSSTISNQLVAGSIIVRHMKSNSVLSLPFTVYGPIRSTHKYSHGMLTTSFVGSLPNFCFFHLLT